MRILDFKDSENIIPILSFYMEEKNITDIGEATVTLKTELTNFLIYLRGIET